MSIIKSFSVGNGDMFYIKHNSDNFTIIDCCVDENNKDDIFSEIIKQANEKGITRFISTHPDDDHIKGLDEFYSKYEIINFYCVQNQASKDDPDEDFSKYCTLRDHDKKHFYLYKDCSRLWMNESNEERDSSGISCLWPIISNKYFKEALEDVKKWKNINKISPILIYRVQDGARVMWMGDLENNFIDIIKDEIKFPEIDILFAPHHGRGSGKLSKEILEQLQPKIIVIGEAPSEYLDYYNGYNTITQNSAADIIFECLNNMVNVYVSNKNYSVSFLTNKFLTNKFGCYIGTLEL